jgi:hypothetical protein
MFKEGLAVCVHQFVAKLGPLRDPGKGGCGQAWLVRACVALGMMLLAAYAVATVQWWGLAPAVTALVLESGGLGRSS